MTAVANALFEPSFPLHAFSNAESDLRVKYMRLGSKTAATDESDSPRALLEKSAALLETFHFVAIVHEVLAAKGRRWSDLTPSLVAEIDPSVRERSGLDPDRVAQEFVRWFGVPKPATPRIDVAEDVLLRSLRAAADQCPIEHLEEASRPVGLERFGHRCRIAHDGIRAFIRRNDPAQQEQLRIAGGAFQAGKLSLTEVSKLLEMHPVDAVALLETHGYNRSLRTLALSEEERSAIYARVRADRLTRGGAPAWTHEGIARDTVASERIEGIDARRWVHREG